MNTMKTSPVCPACGSPLSLDAPQGLCPQCLLKTEPATRPDSQADLGHEPQRAKPPELPEIAAAFPQLEILELIGQGGMGIVYKARQPRLDRLVALKILPVESAQDPSFTERFAREARALAKISHPGIVGIYDFGHAGRFHYLVMEYVEGASLGRMIRSQQIQAAEALGLVMQICEALQFAHDRGVVHRDIKPGNILVDRSGRVKIADFGLAKLLDAGVADAVLTGKHHVMGTPLYMAPEQMKNPLEVDHRADIYSLGVVFYEMLTGDLPVGRFEPPSARMGGVQVDVRLDEVVLRTLEQEPARRYQHAKEVQTSVQEIATGTRRPEPPQPVEPAPAGRVRRPLNQVRGPALGLIVTGVVQWLTVPFLLGGMAWVSFGLGVGSGSGVFWGAALPAVLFGPILVLAGLRMLSLHDYGLAVAASVLSTLATPANLIGLPLGIWSLVTLRKLGVREAFRRHQGTAFSLTAKGVLPAVGLAVAGGLGAGVLQWSNRDQTIIRESPPTFGHLTHDARWFDYAVQSPVNHRLKFWVEWSRHGQRITMPDFGFSDTYTPARGRGFKGYADLVIWLQQAPPQDGTNIIKWQWGLRGGDVLSSRAAFAKDPFQGLPVMDSSYGHRAVHRIRPGQETTLAVVRGDRKQLEGHPWDQTMAGRADLEMRLKVRVDRLRAEQLREGPQTGAPVEPASLGAK